LAFNADQRQLIEKEIIENYPKLFKAMEDEKLSVRNIENIQGDEADAVIISVVYDSTTNMASTYVARQGGKNALNVAVSRAKDKMIVIKSVSYQTIKNANSADFVVFKN
jgi:superfamily I DNA and/or RNA helicase